LLLPPPTLLSNRSSAASLPLPGENQFSLLAEADRKS